MKNLEYPAKDPISLGTMFPPAIKKHTSDHPCNLEKVSAALQRKEIHKAQINSQTSKKKPHIHTTKIEEV
jgi:hypothetical protein